jgi:hypothetical protein
VSHQIWFSVVCGLVLTLAAPFAAADEPADPATEPPAAAETAEKPAKPKPTPRQRQVVLIGVYLLGGVASVGAVLLIWIVWWGSRLRAFNRRPLPAARAQDPFWFLKEPVEKPPPTDGSPSADDDENTAHP